MSATSPRSQIVKRLQDCIPSLGAVQGAVSLEAVFQGNIKPDTAYVYRFSTQALNVNTLVHPGQTERIRYKQQIVQDIYAVVIATRNIRDSGGDDSSDVNDDVCLAISTVLLGWKPPGSTYPLEYERGVMAFERNLLIWTEFYSLKRIINNIPLTYEPYSLMKVNKPALTTIFEMRAVATNDLDQIYHPSATNPLDMYRIIGIALKNGLTGSLVTVQLEGIIVHPSWNWVPNQRVYLGQNGGLTQTPTPVVIGQANTPKSLTIHIEILSTSEIGSLASAVHEFTTTDWIELDSETFAIDFTHDLNSENLLIQVIKEGDTSDYVLCQRQPLDLNTLRITTTVTPDNRFNGRIVILKVSSQ